MTANLVWPSGATMANFVITPVGSDGKVAIVVCCSGSTQFIADVAGYFTSDSGASGTTSFHPITPNRILWTQSGLGAPKAKLAAGSTLAMQITGASGIPSGATAVVVGFLTWNSTGAGYLVPYADGTSKPGTSGIQYRSGVTLSDTQIVPLGSNGKMDIYDSNFATDAGADVFGYFTSGTGGQKYHAISPVRLSDSRATGTTLGVNTTISVAEGNAVPAGSITPIFSLYSTNSTGPGWIVPYADGTSLPSTSTLDYISGVGMSNLGLYATTNGTLDIYNGNSSTDLVVDCIGYLSSS
jgi:hypothetical protein